ncbi:hypothetical protein [Pseudomonas sp. DWP3-1-2]|uniref:hypothetical protein n=1 Tax=Pseudomonas sp. DWP3-1-2 TaxID=2804645 RepID=UPI003CF99B10
MCITMFKKGYTMNNKTTHPSSNEGSMEDLAAAVERFVAEGGVIEIIDNGEHSPLRSIPLNDKAPGDEQEKDRNSKVALLKELVAKGAGISALQYSLRMNKKEIKQLACEQGIEIAFSRPLQKTIREELLDPLEVDDVVAGHAMHYSSLGYTAVEIAQRLGLTVRQVWNIGKVYRFEFKQKKDSDTP